MQTLPRKLQENKAKKQVTAVWKGNKIRKTKKATNTSYLKSKLLQFFAIITLCLEPKAGGSKTSVTYSFQNPVSIWYCCFCQVCVTRSNGDASYGDRSSRLGNNSSSMFNVSIVSNTGPAKPARTYRSNLARSKSFNVHAGDSYRDASRYTSNPHLSRLDESAELKSPGESSPSIRGCYWALRPCNLWIYQLLYN